MMYDWEIAWKWANFEAIDCLKKVTTYEEAAYQDVLFRLIANTNRKGEGKAKAIQLASTYREWLALRAISESDQISELEILAFGASEDDDAEYMVKVWNSYTKLPKIQMLTIKRRAAFNARFREFPAPKRAFWDSVVKKISESAFLTGKNDRGWVADINFILRPDSVAKVIEGKYDNKTIERAIEGGGFESLKNFGWGNK